MMAEAAAAIVMSFRCQVYVGPLYLTVVIAEDIMSRIPPVATGELSVADQQIVDAATEFMGFTPNDALVMARRPRLLAAFAELVDVIYAPGLIDGGLKRLIGLVTSSAAGCQYCVAHTAFGSERQGVPAEKLADVWVFETSPAFTEAERAALRVAMLAGQVPNGVDDAAFADLTEHFTAAEQVEVLSVIALFGFLNRWNATLSTAVEAAPAAALARIQET